MIDISDGFAVGGQVLPWGTTLAAALMQFPGVIEKGGRSAKFQPAGVLGLDEILFVTLYAPALDRPVMQAWYALANAPDVDLIESVSRIFGPPVAQNDRDLSAYAQPMWAVRQTVEWQAAAGFGVGMSIYGAPRETPDGLSAGVLYIHWDDEVAAAAPYLAVMTEFEHWLEACATRAEIVYNETLEENQRPWGIFPGEVDASVNAALLRARRCLRMRQLYQTPPALAESLQPNQALVWKDVSDSIWCISTCYETVCFPLGQQVTVAHVNLLPAKGAGGSWLDISALGLRSSAKSPALVRLAGFLRDEMGAQVSFVEDYDV